MSNPFGTFDDTGFRRALAQYCDLRKNVDPKTLLRKQARKLAIELFKIFRVHGVKLEDITRKVRSLGNNVKIRRKIWDKSKANPGKWTYGRMIEAEIRARRSAKGFTTTGWLPALEKLGGRRADNAHRTGPRRGKLIEKMGLLEKSEELINQQPGAAYVAGVAGPDMQKALDNVTEDIMVDVVRRLDKAARRNGL